MFNALMNLKKQIHTVLFISPEVEHLEPVQFVEDPGGELPHAVVLQTQLLEAGQ